MKIQMVKMGGDIDNERNFRIRGIVPTENNHHLQLEMQLARRPKQKDTSLNKKEYEEKYPNEEYISVWSCFRVDKPEDYYKNSSKEYKEYTKGFTEIPYTPKGILKFLQKFNKNIDEVELTNKYYLDKYCSERGFYKLYNSKLKHSLEPLEIVNSDLNSKGDSKIKFLYTCYSANGEKYTEEMKITHPNKYLAEKYGKEKFTELLDKYVEGKSKYPKVKEIVEELKNEIFNKQEQEKLKIVYKEVGKKPVVMEIEDTLEAKQELVEGLIQVVPYKDDLLLVCNEEGRIYDLKPNLQFDYSDILGNCFIIGDDFENEGFKSVEDNKIDEIIQDLIERSIEIEQVEEDDMEM